MGGWSIKEKFFTDELMGGGTFGGFVFGIITLVESNNEFTQENYLKRILEDEWIWDFKEQRQIGWKCFFYSAMIIRISL